MVDETLILRKLGELDEYYRQIKEYGKITVAEYSGDWKVQRIIGWVALPVEHYRQTFTSRLEWHY